ncbi:hypothetical protein BCV70DRAFT_223149 [Testicularia cyperi]|uniref:C3H1-type domain-containing protein n=1 Tax=Testicularia cyperi TaxID=1882483 RepID=A0A317XRV6_9BASI|nr:hypothetical protein BCV70DRAFT_223149 [Testicularia cyperi]
MEENLHLLESFRQLCLQPDGIRQGRNTPPQPDPHLKQYCQDDTVQPVHSFFDSRQACTSRAKTPDTLQDQGSSGCNRAEWTPWTPWNHLTSPSLASSRQQVVNRLDRVKHPTESFGPSHSQSLSLTSSSPDSQSTKYPQETAVQKTSETQSSELRNHISTHQLALRPGQLDEAGRSKYSSDAITMRSNAGPAALYQPTRQMSPFHAMLDRESDTGLLAASSGASIISNGIHFLQQGASLHDGFGFSTADSKRLLPFSVIHSKHLAHLRDLQDTGTPIGPSEKNPKAELYKTELCRNWAATGFCEYGSKLLTLDYLRATDMASASIKIGVGKFSQQTCFRWKKGHHYLKSETERTNSYRHDLTGLELVQEPLDPHHAWLAEQQPSPPTLSARHDQCSTDGRPRANTADYSTLLHSHDLAFRVRVQDHLASLK